MAAWEVPTAAVAVADALDEYLNIHHASEDDIWG